MLTSSSFRIESKIYLCTISISFVFHVCFVGIVLQFTPEGLIFHEWQAKHAEYLYGKLIFSLRYHRTKIMILDTFSFSKKRSERKEKSEPQQMRRNMVCIGKIFVQKKQAHHHFLHMGKESIFSFTFR